MQNRTIGWEPASRTRIQYSVAKAYRFPVPEELFDNEIRTYGTVLGDATLQPEDGFHQILSVQHGIGNGYIEANLFRDDVDDTIFTQFQFIAGASVYSFLPIDNVLTTGLEVGLDQPKILGSKLDVQVNATVLKSEIREHFIPRGSGTTSPGCRECCSARNHALPLRSGAPRRFRAPRPSLAWEASPPA